MVERGDATVRVIVVQASQELLQGNPQRVLCDEAKKWEADCIYVGAHGLSSALERFRMGSVSDALVTSAPCSVEVVREPPVVSRRSTNIQM